MPIDKNILSKYDEEIKGSKKPDGFVLGDEDGLEARKFKQMMVYNAYKYNFKRILLEHIFISDQGKIIIKTRRITCFTRTENSI